MKEAVKVTIGIALVGFGLGALLGRERFVSLDDKTVMCGTCHHGTTSMTDRADEAPHSTRFDAPCHTCHVLPLKEYLTYSYTSWGAEPPQWVLDVRDPVIDDQSCLECHLARGRGVLPCERCHADGTRQVDLAQRCEVCHTAHPALAPHQDTLCRDCHVEALLGQQARSGEAMARKLAGEITARESTHEPLADTEAAE